MINRNRKYGKVVHLAIHDYLPLRSAAGSLSPQKLNAPFESRKDGRWQLKMLLMEVETYFGVANEL